MFWVITPKFAYVAPPMTQISFVVSLVINSLGFGPGPNATFTGLKHRFGQFALLELYMMFTAAVVDVTGSVGWPVTGLKATRERRKPSGGDLFLGKR